MEGFKDKKINNLIESIEKSKKIDWANFIFSLGIMNIGKKSAFVLSKKFKNIEELKQADIETLTNIEEGKRIIKLVISAKKTANFDKLFKEHEEERKQREEQRQKEKGTETKDK